MVLLTNSFGQTLVISMLAVLIIVVLFSLIFFVNSLSQIKRNQKNQNELNALLKIGQKVTLNSGLIGTIINISQETIDLEVKSQAVIEVLKSSVHSIIQ